MQHNMLIDVSEIVMCNDYAIMLKYVKSCQIYMWRLKSDQMKFN